MTRPAFATDLNKVEQDANRLFIATAPKPKDAGK